MAIESMAVPAEKILEAADLHDDFKHVEWRGVEFIVRPMLSLAESTMFVNSVVDSCCHKETMTFVPEVFAFAIRVNTILRYTNINLPKDAETQYKIVFQTDLFDCVRENINIEQYDSIVDAAYMYFGAK